jgi:iron(III) transport system substrate-binding protein
MKIDSPVRFSVMKTLTWLMPLLAAFVAGCSNPQNRVVLYCAQDEEFATHILKDFTHQTGVPVDTKFDTEADKSVSLYAELIQEKNRPRCDVHWNNEILATIRLQRQGLLEPYDSPAGKDYPPSAQPADHTWHAFAARARILLVNTNLVPEAKRPRSLLDLTAPEWKGKVAMAKPEFGTTATQAACLFEVLGADKAKEFYRGLRDNGIHIEPGNKNVAEKVAQGQYAVGLTDTDDAMGEVEAHRPVTIIFPDSDRPPGERMGTLFIPNTVAVIRGSPNPEGARRLVDYLLSPQTEARLAEGESHQIPMNPKAQAQLPSELRRPETIKVMEVNFDKAADLWEETQTFLRNEFAKP